MGQEKKRILILCPFPEDVAAGQRLKYEQCFESWRQQGYEIDTSPYMDMAMWGVVYKQGHFFEKIAGTLRGGFRRQLDLLRIHKYEVVYVFMWVTPLGTSIFERVVRKLAKRLIYDIEDNILSEVSSDRNPFVKLFKSKSKTVSLLRSADHVITSSPSLESYCRDLRGDDCVTYISSSVDTDRFLPVNQYKNDGITTIGWTGTFSSVQYLDLLKPVFLSLAKSYKFRLRVIGNFEYDLPGVDVEMIQWSAEREVADLQGIDIGVYPLSDDEWVLGKSGLKAIQYMAFGLPVVATDVGTTSLIIQHQSNGLLVNTEDQWVAALGLLLDDADLRRQLGTAARESVVKNYSVKAVDGQYSEIING